MDNNEENTLNAEQEIQDDELYFEEDTDDVDTNEESNSHEVDTTDLSEADELAKAKAEANKWRRIAQKNAKGSQIKTASPKATAPLSVDVDERILKAQGMSDEVLKELKVVATARGVSLIDAQNDYLFVAIKEKIERDTKAQRATLGVSRGSGTAKPKVGFNTPGLSREEHMKLIQG